MKSLSILRYALLPLAAAASISVTHAQTYDGSPYTAWASDYSGSEANTLLLWKFDNPNPKSNSAGSGYGATVTGSAVAGADGGKFGQAFYSPGRVTTNTNYAQADLSTGLFSTSAISVEFWFKPVEDGVTTGNLAYFVDKQYDNKTGLQLYLNNVGTNVGSLSFTVGNGEATLNLRTGALDWQADQWYHVAVTFEEIDGDATLKIFRDGSMLTSRVQEDYGAMVNSPNLWRLGNRLGSSFGTAPGYFDNFRISDVAYQYAAIPEPSVAAILGLTGLGLLLAAKSRGKNKS